MEEELGRSTPKHTSTGGSIVSFSDIQQDGNTPNDIIVESMLGPAVDEDVDEGIQRGNVECADETLPSSQPHGPSRMIRLVLDRKREELSHTNAIALVLKRRKQRRSPGNISLDKVTNSRDFERFRRARHKLIESKKWTATSDRVCECNGVGIRFMFGFQRVPHSFENVAQADVGGRGAVRSASTQPVGYGSGTASRQPTSSSLGGSKSIIDGAIAHIFTFYSKLQSPEHQLGRKPKSYEEIREANSTMSFLELLCFCRDFDIVPQLMPKEDLAVLWKIHRAQMLHDMDRLDTHLSEVQKSSMDLTQFMQMLVKIALMAFAEDLPHVAPWLVGRVAGGAGADDATMMHPAFSVALDKLRANNGHTHKAVAGASEAGIELLKLLVDYLHLVDHKHVLAVVKTRGAQTCSQMNNHCTGEYHGVENKQMLLSEAAVRAQSFVGRRKQQKDLALARQRSREEERRQRLSGLRHNSTGGSGSNNNGESGNCDGGGSLRSRAKSAEVQPEVGDLVASADGQNKAVDFSSSVDASTAADNSSSSSNDKKGTGNKPVRLEPVYTRPVGYFEHFEKNILNHSSSNDSITTANSPPPALGSECFSLPEVPVLREEVHFGSPAMETTQQWHRRYERMSDKPLVPPAERHAMIMPLSPDRNVDDTYGQQVRSSTVGTGRRAQSWNSSVNIKPSATSLRRGKNLQANRDNDTRRPPPTLRPNEVGLSGHHLSKAQKDALALYHSSLAENLRPYVFASRREWARMKVPAVDMGTLHTRSENQNVYMLQIQVKNTFPEMISLEASARGALHDMVSFIYSATTTVIPGMAGNIVAEFNPSAAYATRMDGAHLGRSGYRNEVFGFIEMTIRHVAQGPPPEAEKQARKAAAAARKEARAKVTRAEALRERSLRGEQLTEEDNADIRAAIEEGGLVRSPDSLEKGAASPEILSTHRIPVYLQIE